MLLSKVFLWGVDGSTVVFGLNDLSCAGERADCVQTWCLLAVSLWPEELRCWWNVWRHCFLVSGAKSPPSPPFSSALPVSAPAECSCNCDQKDLCLISTHYSMVWLEIHVFCRSVGKAWDARRFKRSAWMGDDFQVSDYNTDRSGLLLWRLLALRQWSLNKSCHSIWIWCGVTILDDRLWWNLWKCKF